MGEVEESDPFTISWADAEGALEKFCLFTKKCCSNRSCCCKNAHKICKFM